MTFRFGLRVVACFEAAKGFVVLAMGLCLFRLAHKDVEAIALRIVRQLHLGEGRYSQIFLDAAGRLDDSHVRMLAMVALLYSLVRFIEGYGLWLDRRWAEWFGAVSGAVYLPLEVYKLWEGVTGLRVSILVLNCAIVFFLTQLLVRRQVRTTAAPPRTPAGT